jgi:transcription antitermination factor NusG
MPAENSTSLPWYAVYVKYRHEKQVASVLVGKGYDSFVPTYRSAHASGKKFDVPLFPGYVFSRFERLKTVPILSTLGVFSIVGNGDGPEHIPEMEVAAIKDMLATGLSPQPWPFFAPGQSIYIAEGPLQGVTGVVSRETRDRWLVVSVQLLHRSVAVKLDRSSLSSKAISLIQDRQAISQVSSCRI